MRRFFKSLPGKVLLFLLCLISAGSLVLCGIGILYRLQEPVELPTSGVATLKQYDYLKGDAFHYAWCYAQKGTMPTDMAYEIIDEEGTLLAASSQPVKENDCYAYTLRIQTDGIRPQDILFADDDTTPLGKNEYVILLRLYPAAVSQRGLALWLIDLLYTLDYWLYAFAIGLLILFLVCFVALLRVSGRRRQEGLYPGLLHKVPTDLMLLAYLMVCAFLLDMTQWIDEITLFTIVCIGILVIGVGILTLGLCMSMAVRYKSHTLLKNTLVYRIIRLLAKLPLIPKTALIFFALSLLEGIILIINEDEASFFLFLTERAILLPVIFYFVLCMKKLETAGKALAEGNLTYHTDTSRMFWNLKRHGEQLNAIGQGMQIAVQNQLKSERMKTELITNVSHDLKTPLTALVSYGDLIAQEPCENEKITEYATVIVRQSQKLKRLIEDLVEASKAATGNIEVSPEPCEAGVFLTQIAGEYEQRLQQADLTLIVQEAPEPLPILADSRRMWRIFDNLMENICKYAQNGTRVYLTLEKLGTQVVFTFKNISREPLTMPQELLTERFTRGDTARTTEGSGLGLSIAQSFASLQGGLLTVSTDGDLFKAVLSFPILPGTLDA